jgi:hypothetical protein
MEGLIKSTVHVEADMSEKTQITNNVGTYIDRPVFNIEKLVVTDREMIEQVMNVLQQLSAVAKEHTDETK